MSYKEVYDMVKNSGKTFPCMGENENGEFIVFECGKDDNGEFIQTTTAQKNNWNRIETYYKNGDVTETYER